MTISKFFRTSPDLDANTRRAAAKLQVLHPAAALWELDLEVVFYVQFDDGSAFETLTSEGLCSVALFNSTAG